jgi:hypothetical protein
MSAFDPKRTSAGGPIKLITSHFRRPGRTRYDALP